MKNQINYTLKYLSVLLFVLFFISCMPVKYNSEKGMTEMEAFKLLKRESQNKGFPLIKEKFTYSSVGNKSMAHALIQESKGSRFQEGVNVSLLLIDNFVLMNDSVDFYVAPGVYTVNIKSVQLGRKKGRYPITLSLIGNKNNYSFDNFEIEVVSLGGADESPEDYRISGGFCGLTINKNYTFSFNIRTYLEACDCCVTMVNFCPTCTYKTCSWEEINNYGCCLSEQGPEGCN